MPTPSQTTLCCLWLAIMISAGGCAHVTVSQPSRCGLPSQQVLQVLHWSDGRAGAARDDRLEVGGPRQRSARLLFDNPGTAMDGATLQLWPHGGWPPHAEPSRLDVRVSGNRTGSLRRRRGTPIDQEVVIEAGRARPVHVEFDATLSSLATGGHRWLVVQLTPVDDLAQPLALAGPLSLSSERRPTLTLRVNRPCAR